MGSLLGSESLPPTLKLAPWEGGWDTSGDCMRGTDVCGGWLGPDPTSLSMPSPVVPWPAGLP